MNTENNARLYKILLYAAAALIFIVFSSCSVKNEINLSADGSGTARLNAELDDALVFYLQSLAELTGEVSEDGKIFNVDEIETEIEKNPGLTVKSIINNDDKKISGEVSFTNVEQLIADTEETLNKQIITFKEYGSEKEISIYIDIDNFTDIAPLFPVVKEPLFETFGPLENHGLAEDEYLEMMEYALGEGGGKLIKESLITTTINVEGKIISQKGGRLVKPDTVVFETPLLRLLLLDRPIEYSIRFK